MTRISPIPHPTTPDPITRDPLPYAPGRDHVARTPMGAGTVDVSSQVRCWLVGDPGLDFVFTGDRGSLSDDRHEGFSELIDRQLQLTVFA